MSEQNKVVEYKDIRGGSIKLSIPIVRRFLAPNVNDIDAMNFIALCKENQLNPFIKDAYLIPNNERHMSIISRSFLLSKLNNDPNINGVVRNIIYLVSKTVTYTHPDGSTSTEEKKELVYTNGIPHFEGELYGARTEVHFKNKKYPYVVEVSLKEYDSSNFIWKKLKHTMIQKVADAQAFRGACTTIHGNFYGIDEMKQAGFKEEDLDNTPIFIPDDPTPTEPSPSKQEQIDKIITLGKKEAPLPDSE